MKERKGIRIPAIATISPYKNENYKPLVLYEQGWNILYINRNRYKGLDMFYSKEKLTRYTCMLT